MAQTTTPSDARATRRARVAGPLRRVPRPLAALLAAVAILGVAWALIIPPWQAPDEDVHFGYVETLVERGELPGSGEQPLSSAQVSSVVATNTDPVVFFPFAKPEWSEVAHERWRAAADRDDHGNGGAPNAASVYPPAYYLAGTLPYMAAGDADVLTHLYALRLGSVLWLLLTTAGAWLLAGEIFGRRRELQLLAAAVVGMWPMLDFMSASANPDSLMYALWTLSLWLGVRIVRRGITPATGAGFGACVGLAMITKATSLALLPGAAFVVVLALWRLLRAADPGARRRLALAAIAAAVALAIPVGGWKVAVTTLDRPAYAQAGFATNQGVNVREFGSYVWQYYLPRLPFQTGVKFDNEVVSPYPAYNVWIATGWAAFGWVTVYFPHWAYGLFLGISIAFLIAALLKGVRMLLRDRGSPALRSTALPIAVFFALILGALMFGLHLNEYRLRAPTNQGRYLFPLAGLGGLVVAAATTLLPPRLRTPATGALIGLLVVFQLACLALVTTRFYAA